MQGNACALNHQAVSELNVHLSVGEVKKTVKVFGDRQWVNGIASNPVPFQSMPLVYERAFGGKHQLNESTLLAEERNLVGCGFAGNRNQAEMEGVALPNIEDANQLINNINDTPMPAGFAPTCGYWSPRTQWAGTYDEHWQSTRAPYLPEDFDKRFLNAAHPDLVYPGFLKGGEPIVIKGMHHTGDINLHVPTVKISCNVIFNGKPMPITLNIETLTLHPNQQRLSMVWLAAYQCNKKLSNINEVELKLSR
jgi:hypothetical protein